MQCIISYCSVECHSGQCSLVKSCHSSAVSVKVSPCLFGLFLSCISKASISEIEIIKDVLAELTEVHSQVDEQPLAIVPLPLGRPRSSEDLQRPQPSQALPPVQRFQRSQVQRGLPGAYLAGLPPSPPIAPRPSSSGLPGAYLAGAGLLPSPPFMPRPSFNAPVSWSCEEVEDAPAEEVSFSTGVDLLLASCQEL